MWGMEETETNRWNTKRERERERERTFRTFRTFNSPYCNKYNRTNEKSQYPDNGFVINKFKIIHILDVYIMPSHKNVSVTVVARIPS